MFLTSSPGQAALRLFSAFFLALFLLSQLSGWNAAHAQTSGYISDRNAYAEPALPALPAAGGTYRDPVFGTEVMRVTDASECPAPGCGTYYSHWPTFNANNTRLLIRKGEGGLAMIKDFDPVNFRAGASRQLPTDIRISGVNYGGPSWE